MDGCLANLLQHVQRLQTATSPSWNLPGMVKFAPLDIPWPRRLQTLAVLLTVPYQLYLLVFALALLCWSWTRWLTLAYFAWAWVLDSAPWTGRRKWPGFRQLPIWRWMRDYFPMEVIKTAELPPDGHYIFACHPHGILPLGPFLTFATEATGFSEMFPGIDVYITALNAITMLPIAREMSMWFGLTRVDRSVFDYHLSSPQLGRSVALVPGGAVEALDARPGGDLTLTLLRRKGFVRVALCNGAALVPVISFGETELWNQLDGPVVRRIQEWLTRQLTFSVPLVNGRGVFQYSFGLLPHRRPLHVVIGAPMPCPKLANPTPEQVDEYHTLYLTRLQELFDAYKGQYMARKDAKLVFK